MSNEPVILEAVAKDVLRDIMKDLTPAQPQLTAGKTVSKPEPEPKTDSETLSLPVNWKSETAEVLSWVTAQEYPEITIKRVGHWVWVSFPDKPAEEIRQALSKAGFRWNRDRGAWQHACNHFSRHGKTDPQLKYEVEIIRA